MHDQNSGRDHELDALLATYAAVEPRQGLEQRVMAKLRASRQAGDARSLWRSPALAILAAAAVIAGASSSWLVKRRKLDFPAGPVPALARAVANSSQPPGPVQTGEERRVLKGALPVGHPDSEAAPKLERFPAPEPLSEQEKLLVRFVQFDPQAAALVAEERAVQLQREEAEMDSPDEEAGQVHQER